MGGWVGGWVGGWMDGWMDFGKVDCGLISCGSRDRFRPPPGCGLHGGKPLLPTLSTH